MSTPSRRGPCASPTCGPGGFYAPGYFADYPPGYMYVLWVLGAVSHALEPFIGGQAITGLIKLPGILADLGVAWVIFVIGSRFFGDRPPVRWLGSGARIGVIGAAVYLFNPGTIFNSAVWGQMDSVGPWSSCWGSTRWAAAGPRPPGSRPSSRSSSSSSSAGWSRSWRWWASSATSSADPPIRRSPRARTRCGCSARSRSAWGRSCSSSGRSG